MQEDCCQTMSTEHANIFINSHINATLLNHTLSNIPRNSNSLPSMGNFTNSMTNSSGSSVADIVQIPLFTLIILLASIYIILVISRKTLRSAKFTWLTMNVCFATAFFALIQLLSIGIRLNNISETLVSCRPKGFIIDMATCHIMYSHCIASLCRLLSIQYPHKLLFKSTHWLLSNIGLSWIVGVLVALPYLFVDSFTCSGSNGKRFLQIYTSLSTILLPVVIVALCNMAIFRYVRRSTKRIQSFAENITHVNVFSKRDWNLSKIMLLTFCVFVIGWAPLFIQQLFFSNEEYHLKSSVTIFFQILPPTSLLIDVMVLIYSDQPVRNVLFNAMKCNYGFIPCLTKS